jgi:hypothetical protein
LDLAVSELEASSIFRVRYRDWRMRTAFLLWVNLSFNRDREDGAWSLMMWRLYIGDTNFRHRRLAISRLREWNFKS